MDLTQLKVGEKAKFVQAQGGRGMMARLEAMGITPGTIITKISAQFLHGPVIVEAGMTQIAIGFGMARRMVVERIEKKQ